MRHFEIRKKKQNLLQKKEFQKLNRWIILFLLPLRIEKKYLFIITEYYYQQKKETWRKKHILKKKKTTV